MTAINWPWTGGVQPILQSEAAECGLACLAMVSVHHGHRVNIGGLRRHFPISMKGLTLQQLIDLSSELHLAPRALRLELNELQNLSLPAILHWDLNHYVVLKEVSGNKVTIFDPALGKRTMSRDKVSQHFTGVALELTPTTEFKPVDSRVIVKLSALWGRLVNYRGTVVQVLVLSLLLQITALALPYFMLLTIDEAIGQNDTNLMWLLAFGFGFVYLFNNGIKALRSWVVLTLGQSISFQLTGNIVRHMMRLPTRYFESRHVGDLMSRLESAGPIQSILTQGLVNAVIDAILTITTLVVMAMISVPMMLIVLVATIIYLGFRLAMYPITRIRTEESLVADAKEETYTMETIRSIRAIKLHVNESIRENGWRNRFADVVTANYRLSMYNIWKRFIESVITDGQFLIVVFVGATAVIANEITVGMLLAFLSYRSSFTSSAAAMLDHLDRWRLLSVHLGRLSDIVSEEKEDAVSGLPRTAMLPGPSISGENLSFCYGANEPNVLENMNFTIPAGSFVAIVGASGAGKSTLMRVLLGLMPPTSGKILIDGNQLTPASIYNWRARIAAVMQDDHLLSGSLSDNICFFEDRPDTEKMEMVSKMARIHDTIMAMPMAYQSLIGDMGNALSSGQRQRIMLARALYKDPDVLFLDEGTANLDEKNEAEIGDMIASLPITRIAISHRPALVERADFVFKLEGRKMECIRRPTLRQASSTGFSQ
jgi:ATP-binding cassette, subfamily B, bacterial CvaB/MchF/RaxB